MVTEEQSTENPKVSRRKILMEVESHRLELISIIGVAHITSTAMRHCLEQGISVSWLTRGGKFLGRTAGAIPRSADIRLRQYAAASDSGTRSELGAVVVNAKLRNAQAVLRDIQSNSPGNEALGQALAEIGGMAELACACRDTERLFGIEGSGTRRYFDALGPAFKSEIVFHGRKRRPAPDPANALLSFGYTILSTRLAGLLEARGLDPCIGFLHGLRSGRASLALDLLEELRHPVVDRFVLRACNLRILRPEHFEPPEPDGSVRLTREGLKLFFHHWENHLLKPLRESGVEEQISPRAILKRQIERLVASLRHESSYQPFLYGG